VSKERKQYRAPRGIRDVLPEEIAVWRHLEATAGRLARLSGFREIRPALLEATELFIRSVGEVTDIVEKEMFSLKKGDNSLSLRPEGTAGIVRAYVQAGYGNTAPVQKLYDIGPMFRYERPQKGRERMFTQFDVEALGSLDPRLDAEVIALAAHFFEALGFELDRTDGDGLVVTLSSMGDGEDRDRFREALREFLLPRLESLCDLCRSRFERNVLRILDCKNPACRAILDGPEDAAPSMLDFLGDANRAHLETVEALLDDLGIRHRRDPGLVRGLDYYTRTVFEVHYPPLGSRSALCGGGRYDHLVEELGGPPVGAVGCAIGFTPTLVALQELGLAEAIADVPPEVFVASVGEEPELESEVFRLATELRRAGIATVYGHEGKKIKGQMKAAARSGAGHCVILGSDELARSSVGLKDLESGEQREVPRAELVAELRRSRGPAGGGAG